MPGLDDAHIPKCSVCGTPHFPSPEYPVCKKCQAVDHEKHNLSLEVKILMGQMQIMQARVDTLEAKMLQLLPGLTEAKGDNLVAPIRTVSKPVCGTYWTDRHPPLTVAVEAMLQYTIDHPQPCSPEEGELWDAVRVALPREKEWLDSLSRLMVRILDWYNNDKQTDHDHFMLKHNIALFLRETTREFRRGEYKQ